MLKLTVNAGRFGRDRQSYAIAILIYPTLRPKGLAVVVVFNEVVLREQSIHEREIQ